MISGLGLTAGCLTTDSACGSLKVELQNSNLNWKKIAVHPKMATATLNHTPGVHGLASNVSHDVRDMMQSGNYYVTPELANKLGNINCGVESIKLDQQLMASSKDWAARFAPQEHNGGKILFHGLRINSVGSRTIMGGFTK